MDELQLTRQAALGKSLPEPVVEWWLGLARPQLVFHRMDEEHQASGMRVLYVPAGTPTSERRPPTGPDWEDHYSEPFPMYYTRHWAFPDSSDAVIMCKDEYFETYDQYDLESVSFADKGVFALGGYVEPVQDEVCDILSREGRLGLTDWCLLAEWHAELPPNEDLGLSYWAVPQADLEAGRFDRAGMCREIWHR